MARRLTQVLPFLQSDSKPFALPHIAMGAGPYHGQTMGR